MPGNSGLRDSSTTNTLWCRRSGPLGTSASPLLAPLLRELLLLLLLPPAALLLLLLLSFGFWPSPALREEEGNGCKQLDASCPQSCQMPLSYRHKCVARAGGPSGAKEQEGPGHVPGGATHAHTHTHEPTYAGRCITWRIPDPDFNGFPSCSRFSCTRPR